MCPFWEELVPDRAARVLVPGAGNDATVVDLYDAGWLDLTASPSPATNAISTQLKTGEISAKVVAADT